MKFLFTFVIAFMFSLEASIEKIKSFVEAKSTLDSCSQNTLIVFDVDDVLITTNDIFDRSQCYYFFMSLVKEGYKKIKTEEEREEYQKLISLIFTEPERHLIEPVTPNLIKELQERGVHVIALTSCLNGKYGLINRVEDWRFNHLKSLGIDFSPSFDITPLSFTDFEKKNHAPPLFDRGILYCYGYPKGEALAAFLNKIDFQPSEIIFFDDIFTNLESVEASTSPIPFTGYHYQGALLPQDKINFDLIKFQFDTLMEHHRWISDAEAIKLMELK